MLKMRMNLVITAEGTDSFRNDEGIICVQLETQSCRTCAKVCSALSFLVFCTACDTKSIHVPSCKFQIFHACRLISTLDTRKRHPFVISLGFRVYGLGLGK